jgi:phage terminase large subunit
MIKKWLLVLLMLITIDFSRILETINPAYHSYLEDYRRTQIFKGGASAGKSVFICQRLIYNICSYTGYNVLVVRKIGADNHDSTFSELQKAIHGYGLDSVFEVNKSRGKEEIVCTLNDNKIIFRGLDDVEKIKSVTFRTGALVCIWVEEASQISENDYNQLSLRLRGRGKINKHIVMSFNPIDASHWIKARFFDRELEIKKGFICQTTYKDNRFLTKEDKEEIEGLKDVDYYYYMVYALNEWGSRDETNVFSNVKVYDFNYVEHDFDAIRYGQDYGFNHANAMMGCGWKDGELYLFREWYNKRKTNQEFIKIVDRSDFPKDYEITGDSAEPGYIQEWNDAGFLVFGAQKGPGSLMAGVNYLKQLPCIHIHKTRCPNAAREFLKFKYKQDRDGTIHDRVVEIDDDTIAAVRYASEDFFANTISQPVFIKGLL